MSDTICPFCNHSTENNAHPCRNREFSSMEDGKGWCALCRICNPEFFKTEPGQRLARGICRITLPEQTN